jgi:hypothetical protein
MVPVSGMPYFLRITDNKALMILNDRQSVLFVRNLLTFRSKKFPSISESFGNSDKRVISGQIEQKFSHGPQGFRQMIVEYGG